MIDQAALQLLIYQHVVQLTLLDHSPREAFALAHRVAALAFDEEFTRAGIDAARRGTAPADDGASAASGALTQRRGGPPQVGSPRKAATP